MATTTGYAAPAADKPLEPITFARRAPGPHDVAIDILYAGICHSDIHTARNEWHNTKYPVVPGHEIVGKVQAVGDKVTKFKVGDKVGVGCMVESCHTCDACHKHLEQYCPKFVGTYNGELNGEVTKGGYSKHIVVTEHFVVRVPDNLDMAATAPLLCAGITTYSPLVHWGAGPGKKVGVVGLGGLGHMGVKIAVALGAEVTVFTTSAGKVESAKALGAHHVIVTSDPEQVKAKMGYFNIILDTVSNDHPLYLEQLGLNGQYILVGAPEKPYELSPFRLIFGRKSVCGSLIGGMKETQEMLDFCSKHNIVSDIELIKASDINTAYARVLKSDVKYRFVIDASTF